MKIGIVASGDFFSTYGGGQIYVKNLVNGFQDRGEEIVVISMVLRNGINKVITEVKDSDGVKVWQIILPQQNIDIDRPFELQDFVLESIKETIDKVKPDVIHANGWKYAVSEVCKMSDIPCLVTAHHGGILCPNGMLMNQNDPICNVPVSFENCLKCALHFVPGGDFWSPIVQRLPYDFSLSIAKSLKNMSNIPYVSPAFQTPLGITHKLQQIEVLKTSPDCVIAPSNAIALALMRNGVPESRVKVIPHGIRPFEKKPLEVGSSNRPLRFGYVGRISYVKGLHILLDALNLLPDNANYELHIYGDAETKSEKRYRDALKEKSKNLSVVWHGKVAYDKIEQTYATFDVMVLPSICLEVFGLTVLESLSSGRPVVATRCGGPEDIIRDGIDGVLVEPNNVQSLLDILKRCINEPQYIVKLASNIFDVNTLENHLTDLKTVYNELKEKDLCRK